LVTSTEEAHGFVLSPPHRAIEVKNVPQLRADFFQASVTVTGAVECLETPCPPRIPVTLKRVGSASETALIGETDSSGLLEFKDVSPGSYILEGAVSGWCWDSKHQCSK
jgi:hypothetical protein